MKNLINSVGIIHTGKPESRSAKAEPMHAEKRASFWGHISMKMNITASPRWAYPKGIGIWMAKVAANTKAVIIAVRQSEAVLKPCCSVSLSVIISAPKNLSIDCYDCLSM